jgi:hypothetical protein
LNFRSDGEVALSPDVTWTDRIQGGASNLDADLARVGLSAIDIDGGASDVMLRLPPPGDITVPVRIGGGASRVTVIRPAGAVARLRVSRGVADPTFDEQRLGAIGGEIWLESPPAVDRTARYGITIGSGASNLTVNTT